MGAARTATLFALVWLVLFGCTARIVTGIWPGALTGGLKMLLALAISPVLLGLLGESAVRGPFAGPERPPPKGSFVPTQPRMDLRPGTVAARHNTGGSDTLWVKLAPNPDLTARNAVTGTATGVFARHAVAHEVDDSPRRAWGTAALNLIRPWRTRDGHWYGSSLGPRYGDARDRTGPF